MAWEVVESRFEQESGTVFLEIRKTPRLWESVHCPQDIHRSADATTARGSPTLNT